VGDCLSECPMGYTMPSYGGCTPCPIGFF
jgi:hypothetical protein